MTFLGAGLVVATLAGCFVIGGALDRGFPIEVAIVRGLIAFIAVSFVGYLGELVVATAPPRRRRAAPAATHDPLAQIFDGALPSPLQLPAPGDPADAEPDRLQAA